MGSGDAGRTTARRDLAWIVIATMVVAILCARFELSETVLDWTRPHEQFQLDELPGILVMMVHAYRELRARGGIYLPTDEHVEQLFDTQSDRVREFIEERCKVWPPSAPDAAELG